MKKKLILLNILALLFAAAPALAVNINNPAPGLFVTFGDNSFKGILYFFVNTLLGIAGVVSMFFVVVGGYQYITSRGDEEQASAGKKTLTNAIIGLVIVILAFVIISAVINALQGRVR